MDDLAFGASVCAVVPGSSVGAHHCDLIAARNPSAAKSAAYAIAKAAQETLVLTIAQELVGSGVIVNALQVRAIDAQPERDQARTPHSAFDWDWHARQSLV